MWEPASSAAFQDKGKGIELGSGFNKLSQALSVLWAELGTEEPRTGRKQPGTA